MNVASRSFVRIDPEFDFSDEKFQDTTAFFPQKQIKIIPPKIGRREIDDIYAVSIGYRKSYGRFGIFAPLGHMMCETPDFRSTCRQPLLFRSSIAFTKSREVWNIATIVTAFVLTS